MLGMIISTNESARLDNEIGAFKSAQVDWTLENKLNIDYYVNDQQIFLVVSRG